MKNYLLTLLFAFMALTSCNNDEYYYKTPGEITGEKITELVTTGICKQQCVIIGVSSQPRSFHIEGQFLHLDADDNYSAVSYDLNHLLKWEYYNNSYFYFTFNTK